MLNILSLQWFTFTLNPVTPRFWILVAAAGLAGAILVLPFNLWLARRGSVCWPVRQAAPGEGVLVQVEPLTWRKAWAVPLLGIVLLVVSLGLTISYLS